MDIKKENKKKNISYLALRIYAEKLGFKCIQYKKVNKNNKAYTWYDVLDKNNIVIISDRYPKTIKEKLEIIEHYADLKK